LPRRGRILARDVSLARQAPARSSILNVLPARIVTKKDPDAYVDLVVITLGERAGGA
jgi:ABC-type molybdate transport system ATPase subunit